MRALTRRPSGSHVKMPGAVRRMHHGFDDPPQMVTPDMDEAAILAVYRRVRDEIRRFVEELPKIVTSS